MIVSKDLGQKWFDKLPIEMSSLPNIKIPGQSIGELRNSELIDLGFNKKTKVIAGTTDSLSLIHI